jgi:biopolymer transport protein ExbD
MTSEPNVVPMIDILLVLLIIFMIAQPLSRMTLDVQVPPPQTSQASGPSNQIVLEVRDDGTYAINSQPVPKDQLDTQIHAIYDTRPVKLMFVKAGHTRLYQEVIEAMDIARGAGSGGAGRGTGRGAGHRVAGLLRIFGHRAPRVEWCPVPDCYRSCYGVSIPARGASFGRRNTESAAPDAVGDCQQHVGRRAPLL